ncbi:MAG: type I methionyl aminopeptidase [Thermodesulfovibrionales bacterium]|nr:type I methionyl aminopeptidase [Thermodesulfovibrionales bacterium]
MILIKSKEEIDRIADACRIVAETIEELRGYVSAGISTKELEEIAEGMIRKRGGAPAFKGYRGYPSSICASVNDQVIHGIPSELRLKEGDIIGIDIGVYYKGFYGDAAVTLPVGRVSELAERLLRVTEGALNAGIDKAREGNRVSDISSVVQGHVESNGFSVVRMFTGHGIGKFLHEEPQVPNFGPPGKGPRLRSGMTLALEPMVNAGGPDVVVLEDGWTTVTRDGSLSAHFEHTIAVTGEEVRVLTKAG